MSRAGRLALLLALAAALAACPGRAAASTMIRGAIPDQIEKYQPVNGKFTCFDGSKTIDFSQVNDNFCDCPDSSDEPGTSACPNGSFYCRNRGHEAKVLSTSFVDDGVCDCCDGSDELSGCKNTCIEKNSAKRDALRKKIDELKAALDKKAAYAASAAGVRENIRQRHANVDGDIAKAEAELERLTAERKKVEEETEVKRVEHQKEQSAKAAKRREEAAAKAAADAAAAEKAIVDAAAAEQATDQAASDAQPEETDEERGRRIAAQWTNDPAAAGPAGSDAAQSADQSAEDVKAAADAAGASYLSRVISKAKESVASLIGSGEDEQAPAEAEEPEVEWPQEGEEPHYDDGAPPADEHLDTDYEPFNESVLQRARSDVAAAEKKLEDLRAEKERVARQVTYTFNDAWAGLMNKCLTSREPQFSYKRQLSCKLCFFDKAAQVDNGGGHETSLGKWKGFEAAGTEAVFDGGDFCHQHPARSLRVKLECGADERAWGASEPSTCSYSVHASSPAACKAEKLAELNASLQGLLAEEAALQAEIDAEEAARAGELAALRARLAGEGGGGHDEL